MSMPPIWEAGLRVSPGDPVGCNLHSSRRDLAARLAPGRRAADWPSLVAALFSLCGQSHRLCAQLALGAAEKGLAASGGAQAAEADDRATGPTPLPAPLPGMAPQREARSAAEGEEALAGRDEGIARALQLETVREHLRRILIDWPRQLAPGDTLVADLARVDLLACPWPSSPGVHDLARVSDWLGERLLQMPCEQWRQAWQAGGIDWLDDWSQRSAGWLPRLLWRVRADDCALDLGPGQALPADAEALTAPMGDTPIDPMRPLWLGHCAHTGCWSRRQLRHGASPRSARAVLGTRLAELITLCLPDEAARSGAGWLGFGGRALGRGHGLGWVEMARGLLLHEVRLEGAGAADGGARLASARVIAPTEWNFHPEGVAARAIAALPAHGASPALGLLMTALDPCVPYEVAVVADAASARQADPAARSHPNGWERCDA